MTLTHEQKQIKLSAHKQALGCLQNCMAQSHQHSLKTVEQWWRDARAKVREINELEKEIAQDVDNLYTTTKTGD